MSEFNHFDNKGNAIMVDVSDKNITHREAIARGKVFCSEECYLKIVNKEMHKGDVLNVARTAGIMASKKTSDLIPMCHNLLIKSASIDFNVDDDNFSIEVIGKVKTQGVTGVEMEALTAVSVACLTIYDMCKAIDRHIKITDISLMSKTGGKHDFDLK